MSPLKSLVWHVAGVSSVVGAVVVSGPIVIYLIFGLITILALTGTFGSPRCQAAAQVVLAILLGRTPPREVGSLRSRQVARRGAQQPGRSFSKRRR